MIFNANEIKQINNILNSKGCFIINLIKLYNLFKENKQLNFKYNHILKIYNDINKRLETLNFEYNTRINFIFDFNDKNINIMLNENDKQINEVDKQINNIKDSEYYNFLKSFFEAEKITNELIKQYNITDLDKFYPFEKNKQFYELIYFKTNIKTLIINFNSDDIKY